LPDKQTLITARSSQGQCRKETRQLVCNLGTLLRGGEAGITLLTRPADKPQRLLATSLKQRDLDPSNNSLTLGKPGAGMPGSGKSWLMDTNTWIMLGILALLLSI